MDTYVVNGPSAKPAWNALDKLVQPGRVLVGSAGSPAQRSGSGPGSNGNPTSTDQLTEALSRFADAFRVLTGGIAPLYGASIVVTPASAASVSGYAARVAPLHDNYSTLKASAGINTRTDTTQSSATSLGLDLANGTRSRLRSSADLGLDWSTPEAASVLWSAGALGLDLTSPDAASRLSSSQGLGLDVASAQRSSVLRSRATLDLDTTSAQRASTLVSTAELDTGGGDVDPNTVFNAADPNLRPRFDGNAQVTAGSFTVNGTSIAVNADDSVATVLARITASSAGVSATFANDQVTLASKGHSEDAIVVAGDTSGFLSAVKLSGATTSIGNIRDDQQLLARTTAFGSIATGSFSINGATIAVDRATDTLGTVIGKINGSAAGVVASYDQVQRQLVLTTADPSEDMIALAGDTTGFLDAAKLTRYQAMVESTAGLGLDVASPQRATTISSTAEANTSPTYYELKTLSFSGSGGSSTTTATFSGEYTGTGAAANASGLTIRLGRSNGLFNAALATSTRFDILDNTGKTLFTFDGSLRAGQKVYLGADLGLSVSFTAGSMVNGQSSASTAVSNSSKTDVDATARFNNADPNLQPRFDNNAQVGAGSFKVNGTTIVVNANDTINAVLARINASAAGVTASFVDDKLTIASSAPSEDDLVVGSDTSGFLAALKLNGASAVLGNVRDDLQTLARTAPFAAVTSGSFSINGASIAINRTVDTLAAVLGKINGSAAGVTASFDAAQGRVVLSSNNGNPIAFGADATGFLAAARLSANDNFTRGNVCDDQQVLAKTSRFAGVASGSFTVNGVQIAVDRNADSLATLAQRISSSAAGVDAVYDAAQDRLVLNGQAAGMDLIEVGDDDTGFLAAAGLQSANTVRGHVAEDGVALANLAPFAAVRNGSFVVDGQSISVDTATDSVQSLVDKINGSGARVLARYDTASDRIRLQSTGHSEDEIAIGGDTSGFLSAAGLDASATLKGNIRDDRQVLAKTAAFAGVGSGSFDINGKTIAIDATVDTLGAVIDRINAAAAGVTASVGAQGQRIELVSDDASGDLIAVGNDDTGFLAAARLDAAGTERGTLADDQRALAATAAFASVGNGAFKVNGVTIAVDGASDSLRSVIARINDTVSGVSARYDAPSGTLVIGPDAGGSPLVLEDDSSGFLAAAGLRAGAYATRVNADARFDGTGLDSPFFDPGQRVQAGSFSVNGVDIAVADDDSINAVLARITASAAGVSARFDDATQTVTLSDSQGRATPIVLGGDSSGFLAAVKLDGSALAASGSQVRSGFDVALGRLPEYAAVRAGTLTVNGQAIAVDPDTTTVSGLVAAIKGIDGVGATLDAETGAIRIAARQPGDPLSLSDTSGALALLGLPSGSFRGQPGSWKAVETTIGSENLSNASQVAYSLAQAADRVNQALSALGKASGADALGDQIGTKVRAAIDALTASGIAGVGLDRSGRGARLAIDVAAFSASVGDRAEGQADLGASAGAAIDQLAKDIAALAAPASASAPADTAPSDREAVRERLKATFKPDPVSASWKLDLLKSVPALPAPASSSEPTANGGLFGQGGLGGNGDPLGLAGKDGRNGTDGQDATAGRWRLQRYTELSRPGRSMPLLYGDPAAPRLTDRST